MVSQQEKPKPRLALGGELLRFAAAGILGLAVDLAVLYGGVAIGMGWFYGRGLSFLSAVWTTWQFNRHFTFVTRKNLPAWEEWWRYLSAMLLGGAINYATYTAIVIAKPALPLLPVIAVGVGSVTGMVVNFISAKYFVFRRPS